MRGLIAFIAVSVGLAWHSAAVAHHGEQCRQPQPPAIEAGRQIVARAPEALDTRLNLAELLVDASCYEEALAVLTAGVPFHAQNDVLQQRLRLVRSLLAENRQEVTFDETQLQSDALRARARIRCTRLADLAACDQAANGTASDADMFVIAGDSLLRASRPVAAATLFARAMAVAPNEGTAARLRSAQLDSERLHALCQQADIAGALTACEAVLEHGAFDELALRKRVAALARARGENAQALDQYIAAATLQANDEAIARNIVELADLLGRSDATTISARRDALAVIARAQAGHEATLTTAPSPAHPALPSTALASATRRVRDAPAHSPTAASKQTPPMNPAAAPTVASSPLYSNVEPVTHSN
jgi:hypothetical protein